MVIPAKARKEACIDKGDILNVQPKGRGRILLVKWNNQAGQKLPRRVSFIAKARMP